MREMRTKLYELVRDAKRISIRAIHKTLGVNPENEEDRQRVWQIGQCLAELSYGKWIVLDTSTGERVAYHV